MKALKSLCFTLFAALLFAFPAGATNYYVFQAPLNFGTIIDADGTTYTPDSNGFITVTDQSQIKSLINAGCVMLPYTDATASHSYGAAHADWTLAVSESAAQSLYATNASQAANIVATPYLGQMYRVINASGYSLTIKGSGQEGVTVPNNAVTTVVGNGTDFVPIASLYGNIATHDYGGGASPSDWTLSAAEAAAGQLLLTDAGGTANAIIPAGCVRLYAVKNTSGQTITVKSAASGSTGVALATAKQAILFSDGTEVKTVLAAY
jgi:uncharacterized protein RhaS with RHS repeats